MFLPNRQKVALEIMKALIIRNRDDYLHEDVYDLESVSTVDYLIDQSYELADDFLKGPKKEGD